MISIKLFVDGHSRGRYDFSIEWAIKYLLDHDYEPFPEGRGAYRWFVDGLAARRTAYLTSEKDAEGICREVMQIRELLLDPQRLKEYIDRKGICRDREDLTPC